MNGSHFTLLYDFVVKLTVKAYYPQKTNEQSKRYFRLSCDKNHRISNKNVNKKSVQYN